jgi:hypothetical protein
MLDYIFDRCLVRLLGDAYGLPKLVCYCGTVMKDTLYRVSRLYVVFSSCAVFLAFCWGCYLVLDAVFFNSLGRLQSLVVGLGAWLLVFLFVPAIYKLGTTKITNEFVWQGSFLKMESFLSLRNWLGMKCQVLWFQRRHFVW